LPYKFRSTVQDGLDVDVYDAELPVKLGEAVLLVVEEPVDDPVRDATSWFWA
jgi:hypothetical protein